MMGQTEITPRQRNPIIRLKGCEEVKVPALSCCRCTGPLRIMGDCFLLPFAIFEINERSQGRKGRQQKRRARQLERVLNLRVLAMNVLWGGWNVIQHRCIAIHWGCASPALLAIWRNLNKWNFDVLKQPECRSTFLSLIKDGASTYVVTLPNRILAFQDIVADKVAIPTAKVHILPILSVLPEKLVERYGCSNNIVVTDRMFWQKARSIKVKCGIPKIEYLKLLDRLWQLGMITWYDKANIKMVNGIRCVVKDNRKQRLIFDGRPVNYVFKEPEKVELPAFHLLQAWVLEKSHSAVFRKLDLDNYYHRLGVPKWMQPYLGLPPILCEEWSKLTGKFCNTEKGNRMYPACTTLPMGLSHAVLLAQEVHMFLIRKYCATLYVNVPVVDTDDEWCLLYIDDVIVGVRSESRAKAVEIVNDRLRTVLEAYAQVGLIVNNSKVEWANDHIKGLGCMLDGKKGSIVPNPTKLREVVQATRYLLHRHVVHTYWVEVLLGHWVWFLLLARLLFSILFHVYRFIACHCGEKGVVLGESVKREFKILIWCCEGIGISWRRQFKGWLLATDASLWGAGACQLHVTQISRNWDGGHNQGWRIENWPHTVWQGILSWKWKFPEHINVLEVRALVMCLSGLLTDVRRFHDRIIVYVDSTVVRGAVAKGRSSYYGLCCQLKRLAALLLVMDSLVMTTWIASQFNPADPFSRVFSGCGRSGLEYGLARCAIDNGPQTGDTDSLR